MPTARPAPLGNASADTSASSEESRAKRRAQAAAYAARKRKEEKAERLFSEALHRFDISVQFPRLMTIALQSPNEALRNERAERKRERQRLRRQQLVKRAGKSSPPKTRWVPAERGEPIETWRRSLGRRAPDHGRVADTLDEGRSCPRVHRNGSAGSNLNCAKPLKMLVRPRGIEPLFAP